MKLDGNAQPLSSAKEVRGNPTTDYDAKMLIHTATVAYRHGGLSRRDRLKYLGVGGVALGTGRSFSPWAMASPAAASLLQGSPVPVDVTAFLTEVGGQFKGTTIRVVTENTPPGTAISILMNEKFIPLPGVNVEWEGMPLDQVFSTASVNTAQ